MHNERVTASKEFNHANQIAAHFDRKTGSPEGGNSCHDSEVTVVIEDQGGTNWVPEIITDAYDNVAMKVTLCGSAEYEAFTQALEWLVDQLREHQLHPGYGGDPNAMSDDDLRLVK